MFIKLILKDTFNTMMNQLSFWQDINEKHQQSKITGLGLPCLKTNMTSNYSFL